MSQEWSTLNLYSPWMRQYTLDLLIVAVNLILIEPIGTDLNEMV